MTDKVGIGVTLTDFVFPDLSSPGSFVVVLDDVVSVPAVLFKALKLLAFPDLASETQVGAVVIDMMMGGAVVIDMLMDGAVVVRLSVGWIGGKVT